MKNHREKVGKETQTVHKNCRSLGKDWFIKKKLPKKYISNKGVQTQRGLSAAALKLDSLSATEFVR